MTVMGLTGVLPSVDWVDVVFDVVEIGADVDVVAFASSVLVKLAKYQTCWLVVGVLSQVKSIVEGS